MRVRLIHSITGYRDGVAWPEAGQEIELPDWEAENLIGVGYATAVAGDELETPEDGGVVVAGSGRDGDDPEPEAAPPAASGSGVEEAGGGAARRRGGRRGADQ